MNASKVIDKLNRLKPNAVSLVDQIDFINEVEKEITYNILYAQTFTPVTEATLNEELLAPEPYTHIYFDYLCAKIDYFNGDIDSFSLTAQQYNITMNSLKSYCIRKGITPSITARATNNH
jgi:hypothetical protein